MKIAVYGVGRIGSAFAFHLARAGHEVTVIARGDRLAQLQAERAIITVDGERAPVNVAAALAPEIDFDLVLVTVLASQLDVVLPALKASAAKTVMFMFNTFASLQTLRDAVGAERFAFGFPAIFASLHDGKLQHSVYTRGQTTIATEARWAKLFSDAKIPTLVEADMESWLRTHAVVIATVKSLGTLAHARQAGVSWAEAKTYARALDEGFALVRHLGHPITPRAMALLQRAPTGLVAGICWTLSRVRAVREVGATGPSEPRTLVDAMIAAAPDQCATLRSIRP